MFLIFALPTVYVICLEFPDLCFMTVYHLILYVNHRDTLPIVYLLSALHHARARATLYNDSLLQHLQAALRALKLKRHQRFRGISEETGALRSLSSCRLLLSSLTPPPRVKQAPEPTLQVGWSNGRGNTQFLYYISVHSWLGREECAKSWHKTV